jgi:hypothetical protein
MKAAGCVCALGVVLTQILSASPGPVALWRGDGNANDSIGANHGVLGGGTSFASGIAPSTTGQAFEFDGVNDEVRVSVASDFRFTNGFSVTGWLLTTGSSDFAGLLDHFALTSDVLWAFLYVDGVAGTPVTSYNWVANHSSELILGRDTSASGRNVSGQLDEVAVYDRALTEAEVKALAGQLVITIRETAPGEATLSWPDTVAGFHLQENEAFDAAGWSDSPSGTNNPVTVPVTNGWKFYRLLKPDGSQ